jgi:Rrf2 family protein
LSVLTKKAKYALKALAYLAKYQPGQSVAIKEIALAQEIPKKFLDAILCELRVAGLVESKMGKGGGYTLARPATDISVGDVVRVIDGTLAPIACASRSFFRPCDDCPDPDHCAIRLVMLDAKVALANVLDNFNLAEMTAISSASHGQFMWNI